MSLKAAASAVSKTNTTPGTPPPTRTHSLGGGKAKGTMVDRAHTASGGKSNLAVGPIKPKA